MFFSHFFISAHLTTIWHVPNLYISYISSRLKTTIRQIEYENHQRIDNIQSDLWQPSISWKVASKKKQHTQTLNWRWFYWFFNHFYYYDNLLSEIICKINILHPNNNRHKSTSKRENDKWFTNIRTTQHISTLNCA